MKILFINLPYYGHVIPTIGLVQALIKAGHQVTCLMPHDWESKLKDSGADFLGYENNPKLDKQIRSAFFRAEEGILNYDFAVMQDETVKKNLDTIQALIANAPANSGAVKIIEAYYNRGTCE